MASAAIFAALLWFLASRGLMRGESGPSLQTSLAFLSLLFLYGFWSSLSRYTVAEDGIYHRPSIRPLRILWKDVASVKTRDRSTLYLVRTNGKAEAFPLGALREPEEFLAQVRGRTDMIPTDDGCELMIRTLLQRSLPLVGVGILGLSLGLVLVHSVLPGILGLVVGIVTALFYERGLVKEMRSGIVKQGSDIGLGIFVGWLFSERLTKPHDWPSDPVFFVLYLAGLFAGMYGMLYLRRHVLLREISNTRRPTDQAPRED